MSFLTYHSIFYSDGKTIEQCNEDDRLCSILQQAEITLVDLPNGETKIIAEIES